MVFLILCIYGVGCNEAMLQHLRWPTRRVVVIFALVVLLGYLLVYTGLRLGLESETQDWSFKSDNSFQYRNAILVTGGLGRVGTTSKQININFLIKSSSCFHPRFGPGTLAPERD